MNEETGQHLWFLDGWRGLAILTVILGHFWADEFIWNGTSGFGVDLFFVLSGRLMGEILFIRKTPLTLFFRRRFSRVYPGLVAFVAIASIIFMGTSYANGFIAMLIAISFTLNYSMVYFHPIGLMDHLWSLCVEEHAYIILAGLALFTRNRYYLAISIISSVGFLALVNGVIRVDLLHQVSLAVRWRTDVSIGSLFIAAAFWIAFRYIKFPQYLSPFAFIIFLTCKILHVAFINIGVSAIFLALTVVSVDKTYNLLKKLLSGPVLTHLGLWSYSIYLWQQPFYKLHRDDVAPVWILLIGVFVSALLNFYLIEQPARRWLNARK